MSRTNKTTWIPLIALVVLLFAGIVVLDLIINPLSDTDEATTTNQAAAGTTATETALVATPTAIETTAAQTVTPISQAITDETATDIAATTTAVWLWADNDLDDLTNSQELEAGTDPEQWDSDGDGLSDGVEVKQRGSDPLHPDTDRDGTPDPDDADPGEAPTPNPTNTLTPMPTSTPTVAPILIVEFEETDYTINEQDKEATITVTLNEIIDVPVRVDYDTISAGTADPREDYVTTNGQLLFKPEDTEEAIIIPILDDSLNETDEVVMVELSAPEGVTLGSKSRARLTIIDDDEVTIFFSRLLQTELGAAAQTPAYQIGEGRQATILVELSAPSAQPIWVMYATQDSTAQAGQDYNSVQGTLTFNPGDTQDSFTVHTLEDGDSENEVIILILSDPTPSDIDIDTSRAELVIGDND